jgi:two-component system NtrC family sensor kinase
LRSKIGDAITIHKNYGPIPQIMCLPGPLNQVFMNILVNAIQAIQGPGTITITTSQQADNVLVSIRDTGGGISDELINRIFEPFFTTKPIGVGTGLGLSICYDIIKKNNGDITVQSKIGVGTEFIITLPLQQ